MTFLLGRIAMDSPLQWNEEMGDPVTNIGGAPVPAVRSALRHAVDVPTFTSPIGEDTLARRQRLRRQLRALLNNTAYKMQGTFLIWEEDSEQNGWYIPDQGQLAAGADSPLTHGFFKLENFVWFKSGSPRTHRPAIGLSIKDTRTGLWARDVLRRVYNTDFSTLEANPLAFVPAGATDIIDAVKLQPYGQNSTNIRKRPAGRDGGQTVVIAPSSFEPLTDLGVISYEQPESERNKGDVVIYDQRGIGGTIANIVSNPSFEYDTVNSAPTVWAAYGGVGYTSTTFAVQTGWSSVGKKALRITLTLPSGVEGYGGARTSTAVNNMITVIGGTKYSAQAALNVLTIPASTQISVGIAWYGNGGALISESSGTAITGTGAGQHSTLTNVTAPAGAYTASIHVVANNNAGTAQSLDFYVDAIQFVAASEVGPYADGDQLGYLWAGPRGRSVTLVNNFPEQGAGTNLLRNPNFEYDTAGATAGPAAWSTTGISLEPGAEALVTKAQHHSGTQAMQIKTFASHSAEGASSPCPEISTFLENRPYTASVWLKGNAGGEHVQVLLGATADDVATLEVTLTTEWQRFTVTWIPTANRSGETHGVTVRTNPGFGALAYTLFVDDVMLVQGAGTPTYNDGDSPGWFWTGTPGNSVSVIDPQQFGWEEVYGPDYPLSSGTVPYNTMPSTLPPVLDNGWVRVVYDPGSSVTLRPPGFFIYTWNGNEFILQGKASVANEVLQSANVKEYTPERAVIETVFTVTNGNQRATAFITLQRGWRGPRFEVYGVNGLRQAVSWTWSAIGTNTSFAKVDEGVFGGAIVATAGTGSTHTSTAQLGTETMTHDNAVYSLIQGVTGAMQLNAASVIANVKVTCGFGESVMGAPANGFSASELSTSTLYSSLHLSFSEQQVDQIMEAESMTLASGTTNVEDAAASEGHTAKGTRTAEATHVSRAEWPNKYSGIYRVFARVRVTGGLLNIRTRRSDGLLPTSTRQTASPTYAWMDLGDFPSFPTLGLEIRAWGTAGPGAFPSPAATDTFKRATENPLSNAGKWSAITGAADTGNISSEQWHADAFSTISGARWNVAEQTNPAVSLEVTLLPAASERYIGVWACLAAAAKSGYFGRWVEEATPGNFTVTIERWAAGVKTVLAMYTKQPLIAKDSIGIAVRGGVVGVYRKTGGVWSQIGQVLDSTYTKGYTGIEGSGSTGGYNNFAFGEVPAGTPEFYVDRIEAFLMEDSGEGPFTGGRDTSRAVLIDSRVNPTVVTRS